MDKTPTELFAVVFPDGGSTTFNKLSEAELYAGRARGAYGPLVIARFVLDGAVPPKTYEPPTIRILSCQTCKHAELDDDGDLNCTKLAQDDAVFRNSVFMAYNSDGPAEAVAVGDDFGCVLHEQRDPNER
ncbi:MAG TPA: hypothetical protein VE967_19560 [Gemmatimonadaceae bacterium]|nr:hypothetical protein [Gemmatimonadaceae bacterium]